MSATAIAVSVHAVSESSPRLPTDTITRSAHDTWSSHPAAAWPAHGPSERTQVATRRAVVLDEETSSQRQLCGELATCGWHVACVHDLAGLRAALGDDAGAPELVVAEYRLAGKSVIDLLDCVPRELWSRLVIVTAYGSVASAVRAVKLGVGGYLVKPARGVHVLHAIGQGAAAGDEVQASYLSLDRAIWEVLNEAVEQAGTVSGAARRLGLHARSLRRMLAKYPPAR
jgi:two-component system, response regulator RegA